MTLNDNIDDFPCLWVEGKICTRALIWKEIRDSHPIMAPYRRKEMFNEAACKCCLEGQKVEAMNHKTGSPKTPEEIIKHCMLQPLGRRARTGQEAKTTTRLTVIVNEDTEVGIDVLQLLHDYELELHVAKVCNKEFPELCAWDAIQRNDGFYITTRKLKS